MPTLIDAVEAEFATDFAIFNASQPSAVASHGPFFAISAPGFVGMACGYKYARVSARAERWDERPPLVDGWEDIDELPFEEDPDDGLLMLSGFDPGDVGLDIAGLGRGRVQVFARGRHLYHYSSAVDEAGMPPEEWLLRFYPLPGASDPMGGGPRRIAGEGGLFRSTRSPWHAAISGFRTSGWAAALTSSPGFSLVVSALSRANEPLTRLELAAHVVSGMPPWQLGGPDSESAPIPARPSYDSEPDPLATAAGRESIAMAGDAIDAMLAIGLLLVEQRLNGLVLVPNPSPEPAWSRLAMTENQVVHARASALRETHNFTANDIVAALDWVGDAGLWATPRSMAHRWSTMVDDVIGAIRMLGGSSRVMSDRDLDFDVELDPDEVVPLRLYPSDDSGRSSLSLGVLP